MCSVAGSGLPKSAAAVAAATRLSGFFEKGPTEPHAVCIIHNALAIVNSQEVVDVLGNQVRKRRTDCCGKSVNLACSLTSRWRERLFRRLSLPANTMIVWLDSFDYTSLFVCV